jgi:hypothetical protein
MSSSRENLATIKHYSIDLVARDAYTFSVQITDTNDHAVIADLTLDPMDNTLAAVLSKTAIEKLGADAGVVLETLSNVLPEKIGAKEFVVLPVGTDLTGYVPAENAEFKRLRQVSRLDLEKSAALVLASHQDLVTELDAKCEMVVGMSEIARRLSHAKPYDEIFAFLEGHADFTPGKMTEYKDEDVQGKRARFNNSKVVPIAILNAEKRLCGVIRVLAMGNQFGYLSDETMNQELISLDKFPGANVDEQKKNRGIFLLAYLARKTCALVHEQDHFLMIAAAGREEIYDAIGMQRFPISGYAVMMKLGRPGSALVAIKEKLVKPFSQAEAVSSLGVMPAPVGGRAETEAKAHVEKVGLNQ